MISIVSGFMRSGTSAMMAALIAGGLEAAWSEERNEIANSRADADYHPNPSGLYEVPLEEYREVDFPLKYQDKLIKVMAWGLDGLAVNPEGYRVVLMERDPEEIRQSYEGFFDKPLQMPWFDEYTERMKRAHRMLRNRRDIWDVKLINYSSLVENPRRELAVLRNWKIDLAKAAEAIKPELYRFRSDLLVKGI